MADFEDSGAYLDEPPRYDMIIVKFRGDNHSISLPYCEVANGDFTDISNDFVHVMVEKKEESVQEAIKIAFKDFIKLVEDAFDIKEVVELGVQRANSYETTVIL